MKAKHLFISIFLFGSSILRSVDVSVMHFISGIIGSDDVSIGRKHDLRKK